MARRKRKTDTEETTYWLSYSDMMAALLLVFILLITLSMFQARKQFDEKQAQLEAQEKIIEQDKIEAEEAKKKAEEQQKLIEQQQEQIDKIIGVREELITALKDEFAGSDLAVSVDPKTGSITFDSSILFDVDKYDLKPAGEKFLKEFLPRYLSVLLNDNYRDYISEIIIEGHTDTNGSYMHNLELSQRRALSVSAFCLKDDSAILGDSINVDDLRNIVTANGRSYSDPIIVDGKVDLEASRRVEFKFRLQDEQMVEDMSRILSQEGE